MTTDLKDRCTARTTWPTGAVLEQIRIGETDYVRPNGAYLAQWSGRGSAGAEDRVRWIKTPSSEAKPGDGLAACTYPFTSFGVPTKGQPTEIHGSPAIPLVVTDEAHKGSSSTFYVATEGRPYILEVVYRDAEYHTITSFSAFDRPLDVRPPAEADVMDASVFKR
ncbi:hypothetical protein [Streptomyces sp. ISL-36]|uniref:hypothetical protein n=1 Tax=Streptomyces sp. ISL-36 TaxID=2819182 RepID=UPI0027E424EF|nr:hypothetical protein [Streptomyces sp. ISL-36]